MFYGYPNTEVISAQKVYTSVTVRSCIFTTHISKRSKCTTYKILSRSLITSYPLVDSEEILFCRHQQCSNRCKWIGCGHCSSRKSLWHGPCNRKGNWKQGAQ